MRLIDWPRKYALVMIAFNKRLGFGLGFLIFPMIGILLYDVVMRYFFNNPTIWALEMNQFLMGGYFLLAGAYGLLTEAHIRMDILYDRWSKKKRAFIDIATVAIPLIYITLLAQTSGRNALQSFLQNQHSRTVWGPPVFPIKLCLVVGAVLLILMVIALLIRDIYILKGKDLQGKDIETK